MNRTEFIKQLREMADNLEKGHFHTIDIGKNMIFANRNYGQVWVRFNEDLTMKVDLFTATEEEKKQFK